MVSIYNCNCIEGAKKYISDKSIDLFIGDPPFCIKESKFNKYYNRDKSYVREGYVEAPSNYYKFSLEWMQELKRVLKETGSAYIISGWSKADIIGRVIRELDLYLINKIIWHFNFGVNTTKKFITSHYEIFYICLNEKSKVIFNPTCRYGFQEKENGKSLRYKDMQDVWIINKEFHKGQKKNINKLPEELIKKMILYSSNEKDKVCDFFLGNFTTAIVAKKLNRIPCGFELNSNGFVENLNKLEKIKNGCEVIKKIKDDRPKNQGKKITKELIIQICDDYNFLILKNKNKKQIVNILSEKYKRGKFSIINILKNNVDIYKNNEIDIFKNLK